MNKVFKDKKNIFYLWSIILLIMYYLLQSKVQNFWHIFLLLSIILVISFYLKITLSLLNKHLVIKEKKIKLKIFQLVLIFLGILFLIIIVNFFVSDFSLSYIATSIFKIILYTFLAMLEIVGFYGLGSCILKTTKVNKIGLEEFLISIGLGFGTVILLMIILGWLNLFYPLVVWLILLFSFIVGFRPIKFLIIRASKISIAFEWTKEKILHNTIIALSLLFLSIIYLYVFKGVFNAEWDTLHTYLLFPKIYANYHGIVYFPFWVHWGFPQNVEMIFSFNILLFNTTFVYVINYFFGILCLLSVISISKKLDSKNSIFAILLFLLCPLFILLMSGYPKVEIIMSFYFLLIVNCLIDLYNNPLNNRIFYLLAVFSGLLLGIKYTNVFVIIAILVVLIFIYKNFWVYIKKCLIFSLIVLIIFSPWLIKNIIYYNQPLYPLLPGQGIFYEQYSAQCQDEFIENSYGDSLTVFYNLGGNEVEMTTKLFKVFRYLFVGNILLNSTGPWLFIFLPLLFLIKKNKLQKLLLLFSAIIFIFWLIFFKGSIWHSLPALMILLIIYGVIISKKRLVFINFLFLIFLTNVIISHISSLNFLTSLNFLGNKITGDQTLLLDNYDDDYSLYIMSDYINILIENDPKAVIWGSFEPRSYWISSATTNYIPDMFCYLSSCLRKEGKLEQVMEDLGVKYILIKRMTDIFSKDCTYAICQSYFKMVDYILGNDLKLIKRIGNLYLYQINKY